VMSRYILKLRSLVHYLGKQTFLLLNLSVGLGIVEFLIETLFIFVLQGLLIAFGIADSSKVNLPEWYPVSTKACLLIFVMFGVLRSLNTMFKIYTSNLCNQLFVQKNRSRILLYGLERRAESNSNQLMSLFTDTSTRGGWGIYFLTQIIVKSVVAGSLFVIGLWFAPVEMSVGLALLFIFIYPLRMLNKKVVEAGNGLVNEWENITVNFSQGLKNNFFLRAHGLLNDLLKTAKRSLDKYTYHHKQSFLVSAIKVGAPNLLGTFIISVIIFISLYYVGTSGAVLLSFLYIFIRFIQSAGEVAIALNDFKLNIPGLKVLWSFFNIYEGADIRFPKENNSISSGKTRIEHIDLKDIHFSYGDNTVLNGIDISLRRGDRLHIQGKSGSGKSTLISIFMGLTKPSSGRYVVNGTAAVFNQEFYNSISYVGPESFLLSTTVRENMLFGHPGRAQVTDAEIISVLELCCIWQEMKEKKLDLNSQLQEIAELSTGQKQRLTLARALLRNPDVLVLDEATANIDRATEKQIFEKIDNMISQTIFVFIGHKDIEYEKINKVIKL